MGLVPILIIPFQVALNIIPTVAVAVGLVVVPQMQIALVAAVVVERPHLDIAILHQVQAHLIKVAAAVAAVEQTLEVVVMEIMVDQVLL
jgi:hypothetical protein